MAEAHRQSEELESYNMFAGKHDIEQTEVDGDLQKWIGSSSHGLSGVFKSERLPLQGSSILRVRSKTEAVPLVPGT